MFELLLALSTGFLGADTAHFVNPPHPQAMTRLATNTISQEEQEGLRYMREEEKLAQEVYLSLYDQWELPIFHNIAESEGRHIVAVERLLNRYGMDNPSERKGRGVFNNPELQALYDRLVEKGQRSLSDALQVGAEIEEMDIADLQKRVAEAEKEDIRFVYSNLMRGSRNHLRSFTVTLTRQTGETYEPQHLPVEEYESIINAPHERGRGQGFGQQRRGRGHGFGRYRHGWSS
ncbi:DUF2202 domain-containing protein [Spirulina sp. CS-785/01]|uniref:DUF2202 domain-containing protein n=1 Tax=Spirulina sp. CS-785/01 TaxID=3021716 RepID=UPI002330F322|nr:DUF2202 domain-containing protein [Spirulina sp. CS-785/01]MDB9312370.1 DUF2202 domain-containing protein [Spirulina sp. CS-785/01]